MSGIGGKIDTDVYEVGIISGFNKNVEKVCCGGGGPYNYHETAVCSYSGVRSCDDPSKYVSWDGLHLTEAAYRWITNGLLNGTYAIPQLTITSCPPFHVTSGLWGF